MPGGSSCRPPTPSLSQTTEQRPIGIGSAEIPVRRIAQAKGQEADDRHEQHAPYKRPAPGIEGHDEEGNKDTDAQEEPRDRDVPQAQAEQQAVATKAPDSCSQKLFCVPCHPLLHLKPELLAGRLLHALYRRQFEARLSQTLDPIHTSSYGIEHGIARDNNRDSNRNHNNKQQRCKRNKDPTSPLNYLGVDFPHCSCSLRTP